ncbi:hypothetical protein MycrhDRAFT_1567 [Mycolicibacterium rhodesiae JS60]|nr:hypothetical protein MycrhDRAFT_1567 [Mycolicibacterium rhodesiae JS60]
MKPTPDSQSESAPRRVRVVDRRSGSRKIRVVHIAAGFGLVVLAFEAYLLVKWVAGPNFEPVRPGPSPIPTWMKMGVYAIQPILCAAAVFVLYRLVVRPWRRGEPISHYGLLAVASLFGSIIDPLSFYFNTWGGYNSYFINFGSPLPGGIPGWRSFAEPGAMNAWAIFFLPPLYVLLFPGLAWLGVKVLGVMRSRWPRLPLPIALIGLLVFFFVFDIVVEGMITVRLGWYAEGGTGFLNSGTYYQLPWHNVICMPIIGTMLACFCYFRDDRGRTIVERGLEGGSPTSWKTTALRFLAIFAAYHVIMVVGYHLPVAVYYGIYPPHIPDAIGDKSYLMNNVCGPHTIRPCLK